MISRFGRPLISFSLNIPGPDKLSGPWARVMAVGLEAIEQQMRERSLAIRHRESGRTAAGLEAFLVVEADAAGLKELAMAIERDHPLGRLFDLDVLDERAWPLSRESYGESKRACVICGGQTALCRRGGQHTTEVVLRRLEEIVSTYFQAPA